MQVQVGQNSSAMITLKNGILNYIYNNEVMFLAGTNIADGKWHRIEIRWLGTEISMSIDYGQRTAVVPMSQKVQGLYVGKIIIGSPDNSFGNLGDFKHFEGCIQDVRVGGSQTQLNRPTNRENVVDGCVSNAVCTETCPIHSSCIPNWDESNCECTNGYVGPDCVPVCTVKPCAAGVCRVDQNLDKGYRCECNDTTNSGEYCENKINQPCPGGWWGEKVCGPCKCNTKQGYNLNCNKTTGQCYCKENHYQPVNETACLPCDCYSIGSFGGQCNLLTGQCECREGVIGRRCDSCSNIYAEVTLKGCEVVYDACPRSYSKGVWWPRTTLGQIATVSCPSPAHGKGVRVCDGDRGGWGHPDMFNCTSEPFIDLRKQLSHLESGELELNSFISVKMASSLQNACDVVGNVRVQIKEEEQKVVMLTTLSHSNKDNDAVWLDEFDMDYLSDEVKFVHDRLYGADLLITEGLLHELIGYELMQNGLNLSHSQDRYFIKNLVESAGVILDQRYSAEWKRLTELTQRGPNDLVEAFVSRFLLSFSFCPAMV